MDSGVRRAVIVWHRRSGKDKTVLQVVIKQMLKRVGTYWYIFPTFNLGRKALWDGIDKDGYKLMNHFPNEIVTARNESEMRVELYNGSAFQIIGGDVLKENVGANPLGVVFSEFPVGKASAWDYIRPILAENGGFAIFDFTPRGMNHGWKILQQAQAEPGWFAEILTVEDTKVLSPEVLEEEKRQMPEDLFYQEYYCKFIEGAGQFFRNIEACIYEDKYEEDADKRFGVRDGKVFRLGVDLGKHQDFTVITPIDLNTFKVGQAERFNQMDYTLQKARIEAQYFKYNKAEMRLDSTGLGEPIYDDLIERKLKVTPFHFTEVSRRNLLVNLQLLLEQEIIKIPNDPILLDELRSFQYELGEQGKVKIVVPEGIHDDMVFSLALACWDLPVKPLPERKANERAVIKEFDFYKKRQQDKYFTGSKYLRK